VPKQRRRARHDHVLVVNGGRELNGRVCISGSKNAALPLMAATLLTEERVVLHNVPQVADTDLMEDILQDLGATVQDAGASSLAISVPDLKKTEVDDELGRRMRASIVLLGALMARGGQATIPRPGGDAIGVRRVEQHIRGLAQMGAEIVETETHFIARSRRRLRGAKVVFDLPTVTGTENIMLAAALAEGRTEILQAAREPHVQDLARLLVEMGAEVYGAGTDEIVIEGVERLRGAEHEVIPDYLEAGTYAMAVAATGGDVHLECSPPEDLVVPLIKLEMAGVHVETAERVIHVRRDRRHPLRPVDLTTWVHPGFPTDLQAQFLALMTQAAGESVISEFIFENRYQHVLELLRMGARITVDGKMAFVQGPSRLHGTDVVVSDIRSGAALVIAALCATGTTELRSAWHVDRGYQDMVGKLRDLGADVERAEESRLLPSTRESFE
jgi:UDP-N-acetylglucosamine 1-carboxyvinyltransferase